MFAETRLKARCQKILEDNGGPVANEACKILLEDPALKSLQEPLTFISENWRDPLTPTLMKLSCEAVGGQPETTHDVALSLSLMNLSFYLWDDMLDKAYYKTFKPTLFGKFGEGPTLVIGGLALAKAFSILNKLNLDMKKRQVVTELIWNLWAKMAAAEKLNLSALRQSASANKLWVIQTESIALKTCMKLGATLGDGSSEEISHLGEYGAHFAVILELWKDYLVSINLTLELADKLKDKRLPYSLLWAKEHSKTVQNKLKELENLDTIPPSDIKELVEHVLATKTLENTLNHLRSATKKAGVCLLRLEANESTRTLKFLVDAQAQLFAESLSVLNMPFQK